MRKDLSHFGSFGQPGVGYDVAELIGRLRHTLGTDHLWPIALVGVGNLGRALLRFGGFEGRGLRIVLAFDSDAAKVGTAVGALTIRPMGELREAIASLQCRIGIIAVPPEHAQEAALQLVAAGVAGILNFSQTLLKLPDRVAADNVDLAQHLEQLAIRICLHDQHPAFPA